MMSKKKEVVVCAAIEVNKYGSKGDYLPKVFLGCYYDNIRADSDYIRDLNLGTVAYISDGFITNHNRFVTPEEALTITGMQNQLRFKDRKYLLPEDLY